MVVTDNISDTSSVFEDKRLASRWKCLKPPINMGHWQNTVACWSFARVSVRLCPGLKQNLVPNRCPTPQSSSNSYRRRITRSPAVAPGPASRVFPVTTLRRRSHYFIYTPRTFWEKAKRNAASMFSFAPRLSGGEIFACDLWVHAVHSLKQMKLHGLFGESKFCREFAWLRKKIVQGAARLLVDLNLGLSALRWWEKGGIIGKGTSRSFVFHWVSDCHALAEGGTSVRSGGLLFEWPLHYCNSACLPDPVQYLH